MLPKHRPSFAFFLTSALIMAACSGESPAPPAPIPTTPSGGGLATPTSVAASPTPRPSGQTSPTPAATRSPTAAGGAQGSLTPVITRTATPLPAGTDFSIEDLQRAWTARGYSVTLGGQSSGFTGFSAAPREVRLAKASTMLELSVLRYGSREALMAEWNVSRPQEVVPVGNRSLPARLSLWWNENVIVVVRTRTGSSSDALEAFLGLSP